MTLERLRPYASRLLAVGVNIVKSAKLTPNALSVIAFVCAIVATASFYTATELGYISGAIFVLLNGLFDSLDGELARNLGSESDSGEYLDRSLDRYADALMIMGLTAGSEKWILGFVAVTGALLTSFIGSQAQAVGIDRIKGGLVSGTDRLVIMSCAGLSFLVPNIGEYSLTGVILAVLAIFGNITSIQRFISGWNKVKS